MKVLAHDAARSLTTRALGWRARIVAVALVLGAALAGGVSPASAVIAHLGNGRIVSYEALRGAPQIKASALLDEIFHNVDYNGGPVMPSNTNYVLYWDPSGGPAYPSDYQPGLNEYFEDLAHDSGGHENVDSVVAQYNDAAGDFASYDSHFGGALIDTDPYPASGCTKATICLTDLQLQSELISYVSANHLPTDLTHEYFIITPPGVQGCLEEGACSAGSSEPLFCSYHNNIPVPGGEIIYADVPYMTGNPLCDEGNHPNGTTSDGALQGGLVHEQLESLTDPEPSTGWTDLASGEMNGYEVADKCRFQTGTSEFGTPLGKAPNGANYNQVINGHFYWYQQVWSNQNHACLQRLTFTGTEPAATFTSTAGTETEVGFNATGSTASGGVAEYSWQFNDGSAPIETTTPTLSHLFPADGSYNVALTVYATDGTSIGTAKTVQVTAAPGSPSAETTPATAITQTAATLNATVNPNGGAISECTFEYGTSQFYEFSAPCATLPAAGSSPVAVSAAVSNLTPGTTYHFRLIAKNTTGTGEGADETFKTLAEVVTAKAPTVQTTAASAITQTTGTLNATVNPNGGAISECTFEYGTTSTPYEFSAPCSTLPAAGSSPVAVSAAVSNLTPGTTYHFRVIAKNTTGAGEGADETFKTLAEVITAKAPTVQTTAATAITQTAATLNATVNPNGGAISECTFEYGTSQFYEFSAPCSTLPAAGSSPVAVAAAVSNLTPDTTYHFRVIAKNTTGASEGADETFKTLAEVITVTAPTVQTAAATSIAQTTATLNATVNPNGGAISECTFEYGTTSTPYEFNAPCATLPAAGSSPVAVSAAVSNLTPGTTYHFRLIAKNTTGAGEGADETFKTLAEAKEETEKQPEETEKQPEETEKGQEETEKGHGRHGCWPQFGAGVDQGYSQEPLYELPVQHRHDHHGGRMCQRHEGHGHEHGRGHDGHDGHDGYGGYGGGGGGGDGYGHGGRGGHDRGYDQRQTRGYRGHEDGWLGDGFTAELTDSGWLGGS